MSDGGQRGDDGDDPSAEAVAGAGPDFEADGDDGAWAADPGPERVDLLREVAEEVRGDSSESQQLSAILYRVSDLYDAEEETTPEEIYRNVRFMMQVNERGGLRR